MFDMNMLGEYLRNNLETAVLALGAGGAIAGYTIYHLVRKSHRYGGIPSRIAKASQTRKASSSFGVRGDAVHVIVGPTAVGKTSVAKMLTYSLCEHGMARDVTTEDDWGVDDRGSFDEKTRPDRIIPHVLEVCPDGPLAEEFKTLSGKTFTLVDVSGEMLVRAAEGVRHPALDAVMKQADSIIIVVTGHVSKVDTAGRALPPPIWLAGQSDVVGQQVKIHERALAPFMPKPIAFALTKLDLAPRAFGSDPIRTVGRRLIRLIQFSSNARNPVIVPTNPKKWDEEFTELPANELEGMEEQLGIWPLVEFIARSSERAIVARK